MDAEVRTKHQPILNYVITPSSFEVSMIGLGYTVLEGTGHEMVKTVCPLFAHIIALHLNIKHTRAAHYPACCIDLIMTYDLKAVAACSSSSIAPTVAVLQ